MMQFIRRHWVGFLVASGATAWEVITWIYERDWNFVISLLVDAYHALFLRIDIPLWVIFTLVFICLFGVAMFDAFKDWNKKRRLPKAKILTKLQSKALRSFKDLDDGYVHTLATLTNALEVSNGEAREILAFLHTNGLIEETLDSFLEDEKAYVITHRGALVGKA
jgi:hypothetical protein